MKKIFISYRRADSSAEAGRLYDRLAAEYGHPNVFMDVDDIRPGENYHEAIERRISKVDTLIVLVGPHWLDARDEDGNRRLDDPKDLARQEIETALKRGVRVIPTLVRGAELPDAEELPESLRPLLDRHAFRLSHAGFHDELDSLITRLGGKIRRGKISNRKGILIGAAGTFVLLLVIGWMVAPDEGPPQEPTPLYNDAGKGAPGPDPYTGPPSTPYAGEPSMPYAAPAPAVNLSGTWYDNNGYPYTILHEGNSVQGTAYDPYTGGVLGTYWGTFDGVTMLYDWQNFQGNSGSGSGTVEPDGQHMSVVTTDAFGLTEGDRLHREHLPH